MSALERIALIGFGEVGQILATDLVAKGATVSAFDLKFASPDSVPSKALANHRVTAAKTAPEAVKDAQFIVSAVTAASAFDAAKSVVPGLPRGAFFLDINSASPAVKQNAAKVIDSAGGRYVEAAVMSPVPIKRIATHILLGGPHAQDFLVAAKPLGFNADVFAPTVGPASATKMCRSVMVKGIQALLTESMLSARRYGVEDVVLKSLSDLFPLGDWKKLAHYMIQRGLGHAVRHAEEMREAARTVSEAGVDPWMTRSIVERQNWAAGYKDMATDPDFGHMLDTILSTSPKLSGD